MTTSNRLQVAITREEISLILRILKAPPIIGMLEEQRQDLTDEVRRYGFIYADRSLRARGLARLIEEDGEQQLKIREDLLYMLAVAAQPQTSIVFTHIPQGAETGEMVFGHINGDRVVRHHSPEPAIHHFEQLTDVDQLLQDFIQVAGLPQKPIIEDDGFYLNGRVLSQVKQLIREEKNSSKAKDLLGQCTTPAVAKTLTQTLSHQYAYSQFQIMRMLEGNRQMISQLTLIAHADSAWLSIRTVEESEQDRHFMRPVSFQNGCDYLKSLLEVTIPA